MLRAGKSFGKLSQLTARTASGVFADHLSLFTFHGWPNVIPAPELT